MKKPLNTAIIVTGLAVAGWAWHATREVSQRDQSLAAASQKIDQLNHSLSTAREELSDARAQLDESLDAAERAREAQSQNITPPAAPPLPQTQSQPTSPIEVAQLQIGPMQDAPGAAVESVLQLKDRH